MKNKVGREISDEILNSTNYKPFETTEIGHPIVHYTGHDVRVTKGDDKLVDSLDDVINSIQGTVNVDSEDAETGVKIVMKALGAPVRQIAENAGKDGSVILDHLEHEDPEVGYNAATDKWENMVKAGIIDPTKVTRSALQNAASIAALLLTTEAVVADEPEDNKAAAPAAPNPGMGMGM